jgi:hypothetical protein
MIPVFLDSARKHKNLAHTYKNWRPDVHKTVDMVYELVEVEDFEGLRKISQQYIIQNAFYPLQFGLHNSN